MDMSSLLYLLTDHVIKDVSSLLEKYWLGLGKLKEKSVILTTSLYPQNQKILTKKVISRISVDSNFMFRHDYVHWHYSIDSCVKLILIDENLCENLYENCLFFTLK